MRKKVIKFSIKKYRKWCKKHNLLPFEWADDCKNQTVSNWNGMYGMINGYLIEKSWTVIKYE